VRVNQTSNAHSLSSSVGGGKRESPNLPVRFPSSTYGFEGLPPSSVVKRTGGERAGMPPSGYQSYSSLPHIVRDDEAGYSSTRKDDMSTFNTPSSTYKTDGMPPSSIVKRKGDERAGSPPSGLQNYSSLPGIVGDEPRKGHERRKLEFNEDNDTVADEHEDSSGKEEGEASDEPWRYLSAESALAGGWRNGGGE
jgi:hypothetical protein